MGGAYQSAAGIPMESETTIGGDGALLPIPLESHSAAFTLAQSPRERIKIDRTPE